MHTTPLTNPDVIAVFESYPEATKERLLALRQMVYEVAAETEGVGELEETLKWGQISYLTSATKSGTTIRIDAVKDHPEQIGMYVNCQTTLVETFRTIYGDALEFEGTRCVKFPMDGDLPVDIVKHCIELALTYHQRKKNRPIS